MNRVLTSAMALLLSATLATAATLEDRTARIDNLKCTVLLVFWEHTDILEDDIAIEINSFYRGFVRGGAANIDDFKAAYTETCNAQQGMGLFLAMRKALDSLKD